MRIKSEISSLSNSKSPDFLEDLRKTFRNRFIIKAGWSLHSNLNRQPLSFIQR